MAKFGRFDSGNRKRNRHKNESRNGYFKKIKMTEKGVVVKKKIDVRSVTMNRSDDV
jgi:hypothetical protein